MTIFVRRDAILKCLGIAPMTFEGNNYYISPSAATNRARSVVTLPLNVQRDARVILLLCDTEEARFHSLG